MAVTTKHTAPTKQRETKQRERQAEGRTSGVTSARAGSTVPSLGDKEGATVARVLQSRLTSLIDLSLTLKHIHWNVVGAAFIGVHQMLDPQHAGVSRMTDQLAERIATLGGVPNGLPGRLVADRTWDDYSLDRADSLAHLGALDLVYHGVISDHRAALDEVGALDPISEDLLIGQTGELEQYQWFVRSHLADWAGGRSNAGATSEIEAARSVSRKPDRRSSRRAVAG